MTIFPPIVKSKIFNYIIYIIKNLLDEYEPIPFKKFNPRGNKISIQNI